MEEKRSVQRTLVGKVVSDKMQKTLVVEVSRSYQSRTIDKVLRTAKRYKAHYEGAEQINVGDTVEMVEGRPVSKTKYMYVTQVVAKRRTV